MSTIPADSRDAETSRQRHLLHLESLEKLGAAIGQMVDLEEMLARVMTTLREIFAADRAWLLYPCDPEGGHLSVPVESTVPAYPGACEKHEIFPLTDMMAATMRTLLESRVPCAFDPQTGRPIDSAAARFGVRSQLLTAIFPRVGPAWVMGLHQCSHARIWEDHEQVLFQSLAQRITDALTHVLLYRNLRISEERYRSLVSSLTSIVWTTNAVGLFDEPQQSWEKYTGQSWDEYRGSGYMRAVHPDDRERVIGLWQQAVEQASLYESQGRLWHAASGRYRYFNSRGAPLCNADGTVREWVGTVTDIDEQQTSQFEREALIRELEDKNAELERFTYTVSHDLKSPLITIKGFLGMLEQDLREGNLEQLQADIMRIGNAADRMKQLLDELLELSRIGRVVNPPERINLGELAREALELLSGSLSGRGVKVSIADELPDVCVDRVRIREVLQNLVDNAVKFMGDEPEPHIQIGGRHAGSRLVCTVQDNGIGIEPGHHERIFGLFEQLATGQEGSGIGLALARRIVEVAGGKIWVESAGTGHGTTVCFTTGLPKS